VCFGDLPRAHSAEEAAQDDLFGQRVDLSQGVERLVEVQPVDRRGGELEDRVQLDPVLADVSLGGHPAAHVIDDHPPSQPRRDGEEVRAVLPVDPLLGAESEEGLVHESGGSQRRRAVGARQPLGGDRS
jgi:hypothetical protein